MRVKKIIPLMSSGLALAIFGASVPVAASDPVEPEAAEAESAGLPAGLSGEGLAQALDFALMDDEIGPLIDAMMDSMAEVGEAQQDWNKRGVFLPDYLAAQPGGMFGSVLHHASPETPSIQGFGPQVIEFPAEYNRIELRQLSDLPVVETSLVGLQSGMWLEIRARIERVGNAVCYDNAFGIAVRTNKPVETWTETDIGIVLLFYGLTKESEKLDMCVIYEAAEDGTLTSRAYNRAGQPYTTINAEEQTFTVQPASESAPIVDGSTFVEWNDE